MIAWYGTGGPGDILLPPAARRPPRSEAGERGILREAGHGETDRLWFLQQVQPGSETGDVVRIAGLFGPGDPARRLLRRPRRRYLVAGCHSLYAGVRSPSLSGTRYPSAAIQSSSAPD